ncbi:MAG: HAMP domain-containing histidine kinase [Bacteroidales bacterium]|nr:HAMP domain-containing histidine kinase [Bacteroidales bacterium]
MDIYYRKQRWKLYLILFAAIIGIGSLLYTNRLVKLLADEEKKKIELWAEATRRLADLSDITEPNFRQNDPGFPLQVVEFNTTIPVIIADQEDNIMAHRNLDSLKMENPDYSKRQLGKMKSEIEPIEIDLGDGIVQYVYYRNSTLLVQLTYYPYIQLGVILLFILVAYLAFSASRRAEQNQVWVGLSKETAHQLGTPTSSLMGWVEILKEKHPDKKLVSELEKDAGRLEEITERFSKIGSKPVLKNANILEVLKESVEYLESRTSDGVTFTFDTDSKDHVVPINRALFQWVVENLCKNSVDAMEGNGTIKISVSDQLKQVLIDFEDSGKGIPKNRHKTIFKPGYTTKRRGWGLGLSLAKRIIEIYHKGKIFVLNSETGKGAVIRIILHKSDF